MPAKQELGRSAAEVAITYDFVKANEEYLNEGHKPEPSDLTRGPRSYTAVITCIDSRATPEHWYDLRPNEVWSLRNGGGRANDPGLLRSLMILQATSEVKEIRVLHHKSKLAERPPNTDIGCGENHRLTRIEIVVHYTTTTNGSMTWFKRIHRQEAGNTAPLRTLTASPWGLCLSSVEVTKTRKRSSSIASSKMWSFSGATHW